MDWVTASATIPCPYTPLGQEEHETCLHTRGLCDGSGRVYLFDTTVRQRCSCFRASYGGPLVLTLVTRGCEACSVRGGHCDKCAHCEGRDWVPSKSIDVWQAALVASGANVVRTWWNRDKETWWADVRLQTVHRESSVVEGETLTEALCKAIEVATEKVPGVRLQV